MVSISAFRFEMRATACCSAANAALVSIHAFKTDLISSSTAGGNNDRHRQVARPVSADRTRIELNNVRSPPRAGSTFVSTNDVLCSQRKAGE